jgi:hypothetical protein
MAPTHGMVVLAERQNPQHPHVENKNEKFTREKKTEDASTYCTNVGEQ